MQEKEEPRIPASTRQSKRPSQLCKSPPVNAPEQLPSISRSVCKRAWNRACFHDQNPRPPSMEVSLPISVLYSNCALYSLFISQPPSSSLILLISTFVNCAFSAAAQPQPLRQYSDAQSARRHGDVGIQSRPAARDTHRCSLGPAENRRQRRRL